MDHIDTAAIRARHQFRTNYGAEMDHVCQFCWPRDIEGNETDHDCEVVGYMDEIDALRTALAALDLQLIKRGADIRDLEQQVAGLFNHIADQRLEIERLHEATAENAQLRENTASIQRDRNDLWHQAQAVKARFRERAEAAERRLTAVRELAAVDWLRDGTDYQRGWASAMREVLAVIGAGDSQPAEPADCLHMPGKCIGHPECRERAAGVSVQHEPPADHVGIFDGLPLLDDCGQPFPCAHRAYNPDVNHPMAAGSAGE